MADFMVTDDFPDNQKASSALRNVSCSIADGSFVLLTGTSGCGKTTLTRLINGLIPHYYEGTLTGSVRVDGKEINELTLFDLSLKVGSVFQNPRSQFFNVDTTSEIAFGCENHGMPEEEIRRRVEQVAEQLNLTGLLNKSIFSLSGGEKQKIACGSAAAVAPDIYVLDEPSSNLDAFSISDFRELLKALKAQGKTVIIAEHRLYYLMDLVDRVIYLNDGEIQGDYATPEFRLLPAAQRDRMGLRPFDLSELGNSICEKPRGEHGLWELSNFHFAYHNQAETLCIEKGFLPVGSVTAVIGHNGAGKTTFSRCLCGLEKHCKGVVRMDDTTYSGKSRLKLYYIIILDEATASIDPENEHLIQEALSALTHGKTIITIAHRLATIENADQILVVNEGRIAQKGTHTELIEQEGIYRKFVEIREQAEGWRIA